MGDHRRSYAKTAGAALVAALTALLLLGWLARLAGTRGWPIAAMCAAALAAVGLLGVAACMALVAVGGAVAIRRQGFESRGIPYVPQKPREWAPGTIVRWMHRAMCAICSTGSATSRPASLLPGGFVEIRGLDEIMRTLDSGGRLDGLLFMPEMARFCGGRTRVFRRIEKVHDYVTASSSLRRMRDTVSLEDLRCAGDDHGGCQVRCQLLWKEAWLRRVEPSPGLSARTAEPHRDTSRQMERIRHFARQTGQECEDRYVCQMTEIARASTPMAWADPRHYLRDLLLGNVRPVPFIVGVALALFNCAQRVRRRAGYPDISTTGEKTSPQQTLDLRPGEVVRVKDKHEIECTLTAGRRNRGLWFDGELVRFCGGEYRVAARIEHLIEEKSGKLLALTNPCIILDGVTATGEYLGFCPQNESILWREIWLERVQPQSARSHAATRHAGNGRESLCEAGTPSKFSEH